MPCRTVSQDCSIYDTNPFVAQQEKIYTVKSTQEQLEDSEPRERWIQKN